MSGAAHAYFKVLLAAVVFATGAAAGAYFARSPLLVAVATAKAELATAKADMADLRTTHAETARLAAMAAATTLQQAQQRGDVLTDALAQRQVQIDKISREKRDAINRLTTGRVCFSGAAVRMLNDDPADYGAPAVPPATSGPDAADAAAATDTDIGHWIVTARAQYATCRQRLDALIDWHAAPLHNPLAATSHDD